MTGSPSVLVVDSQEETHEVLRAALSRRGIDLLAAGGAEAGLQLARTHRPDVIVLDLEGADAQATARFADARPADTPLVLIGSLKRQAQDGHAFVAKPYHYGALIRKIENLLDGMPAT